MAEKDNRIQRERQKNKYHKLKVRNFISICDNIRLITSGFNFTLDHIFEPPRSGKFKLQD